MVRAATLASATAAAASVLVVLVLTAAGGARGVTFYRDLDAWACDARRLPHAGQCYAHDGNFDDVYEHGDELPLAAGNNGDGDTPPLFSVAFVAGAAGSSGGGGDPLVNACDAPSPHANFTNVVLNTTASGDRSLRLAAGAGDAIVLDFGARGAPAAFGVALELPGGSVCFDAASGRAQPVIEVELLDADGNVLRNALTGAEEGALHPALDDAGSTFVGFTTACDDAAVRALRLRSLAKLTDDAGLRDAWHATVHAAYGCTALPRINTDVTSLLPNNELVRGTAADIRFTLTNPTGRAASNIAFDLVHGKPAKSKKRVVYELDVIEPASLDAAGLSNLTAGESLHSLVLDRLDAGQSVAVRALIHVPSDDKARNLEMTTLPRSYRDATSNVASSGNCGLAVDDVDDGASRFAAIDFDARAGHANCSADAPGRPADGHVCHLCQRVSCEAPAPVIHPSVKREARLSLGLSRPAPAGSAPVVVAGSTVAGRTDGANLVYRVRVDNNGPSDATHVRVRVRLLLPEANVTDVLVAGADAPRDASDADVDHVNSTVAFAPVQLFRAAAAGGGGAAGAALAPHCVSCANATRNVDDVWLVPTIGAGRSALLDVRVRVADVARDGLVVRVEADVLSVDEPAVPALPAAVAGQTTVRRSVTLRLPHVPQPPLVVAGARLLDNGRPLAHNVRYAVRVVNDGPSAATALRLSATFTVAGDTEGAIQPVASSERTLTLTRTADGGATRLYTVTAPLELAELAAGAHHDFDFFFFVDACAPASASALTASSTLLSLNEPLAPASERAGAGAVNITRVVDLRLRVAESVDPVLAGAVDGHSDSARVQPEPAPREGEGDGVVRVTSTGDDDEAPGGLVYWVLVENRGPSCATGVVVSTVLRAPIYGVAPASNDALRSNVGVHAGFAELADGSGFAGEWRIDDLPPIDPLDASVTSLGAIVPARLTVPVFVGSNAEPGADAVRFEAAITAANELAIGDDPGAGGAAAQLADARATSVLQLPDLRITKRDTADPVDAVDGTRFQHIVTVTNNDHLKRHADHILDPVGVYVVDRVTLPSRGVRIVDIVPATRTELRAQNEIRWAIGALPKGETRTMEITFELDRSAPQGRRLIVDRACVNASLPHPRAGAPLRHTHDDAAVEETSIGREAGLTLTSTVVKRHLFAAKKAGEHGHRPWHHDQAPRYAEYEVIGTLTNGGPSEARDIAVTIDHRLPVSDRVRLHGIVSSAGLVTKHVGPSSVHAGENTWAVSLLVGESAEVRITLRERLDDGGVGEHDDDSSSSSSSSSPPAPGAKGALDVAYVSARVNQEKTTESVHGTLSFEHRIKLE